MNKRIIELAEQAGIEFTYDPTETPMRAFAECWEDELAKFAELIVRECADIAINAASDTNFITGISEADRRALSIAVEIKQHFGVEV